MCYDAGPHLRAAAALSPDEVTRLRAAGLRSLPSGHSLRALAQWARGSWRTAVRLHALRHLVRSPAALAQLSPRAQDMLFAVFRTVNASNRDACAGFFGVLLLAEDPWVLDVGGDAAVHGEDARSAATAFLRLYDARHQFLGNIAPGAAAFAANPDLLHRESDALRRHLVQTALPPPRAAPALPAPARSALKARRLHPAVSPASSADLFAFGSHHAPSAPASSGASTSAIRAFHRPLSTSSAAAEDYGERNSAATLESRVGELTREVERLKVSLEENQQHTNYLQSLLDFMAKVLLDELQTTVQMPGNIVSTNRAGHSIERDVQMRSSSGSPTLSETGLHSGRPPSGPRDHSKTPSTVNMSIDGQSDSNTRDTISDENRIRLLSRFRSIMEASPWSSLRMNGSAEEADSPATGLPHGVESRPTAPVKVFRNGQWVERSE